jgi:rubrerythrin
MCGHSHYLHYKKRLRPTTSSAALLVGSALDEAINAILEGSGDPMAAFLSKWEKAFINGKEEYLPTSTRIVYAEADFDSEILTEKDKLQLSEYLKSNLPSYDSTFVLDAFQAIKQIKKNPYKKWTEEENKYYNLACWLSWTRKAEYIMDAYKSEVMPKIKKVVAVQKKIEMTNGDGDAVEGFIDLIAEWEDGKTYILDNKSSAREYAEDSPSTKPQLHLYAIAENNPNVGFIVYLKNLEKNRIKVCKKCGHTGEGRHKSCDNTVDDSRCGGEWDERISPKAKIQILLGSTNPVLEELVLENINDVNKMLKNDIYAKNLNACDNWYGGQCPYYKACHNKDNTGLEEV